MSSGMMFPYKEIRIGQEELIESISKGLEEKKNVIAHAPTGLGKTVAALSPLIPYAKKEKKKIIFMTSRHTQHRLAIDTCRDIKKAFDDDLVVSDLIGKQWMCSQPGVSVLYSGEFSEYCRSMREGKRCEFYSNTRKNQGLTPKGKDVLEKLTSSILHSQEMIDICTREKLCPYEVAFSMIPRSDVIITDYHYIFNPEISEIFLKKAGLELPDCLLVIDEAHNLPGRIRDLLSVKLTSVMLRRAIKEAKKFDFELGGLVLVQDALNNSIGELRENEEKAVEKGSFQGIIEKEHKIEDTIGDIADMAEEVRKKERISRIGPVAEFLHAWQGSDDFFIRIAEMKRGKNESISQLSYICLDPAMISRDVFRDAHFSLLMSGTLLPTGMYRDILGIDNAIECTFPSPFPKDNVLHMIVPMTTTKFSKRNIDQYKEMARIIAEMVNNVPGNSIVFFPSYILRDSVYSFLNTLCRKTVFLEMQELTKDEKDAFLERFKGYKDTGAVILGVIAGSFAEGIDLPGDELKCVIIVGLPLQKPDLRTKALIDYYEKKLNKGWDYGYVLPAFTKTIQSAGRCIRTETDRGAIIFLEERYAWPNYIRCFPEDWDLKITKNYSEELKRFFSG